MATSTSPKTSGDHSDFNALPEINKTDEGYEGLISLQRDFMLSSVIRYEDDLLAFGVTDLETYLNEQISLEDFAREIPSITFIVIVQWEDDPREREEISFDKLDNSIYIQKKVFPSQNIKIEKQDLAWKYNVGQKLIEALKELDYLVPSTLFTKLEEVIENLLEEPSPGTS